MASFAQEESRSISDNVRWGLRKRMADGKYWVSYSLFLGYGRGFIIEPEDAYIVRLIYRAFLQGLSGHTIAKYLTEKSFHTPKGGTVWHCSTIISILSNEKYKGDDLSQKKFTKGFPERKEVKNKGEVEQYYVTVGHEAIIDPVLFDYVQDEINGRWQYRKYSGIATLAISLYAGSAVVDME